MRSLDAQAALSLPVKALALQPPAVRKSTERNFTPWKYPEKTKARQCRALQSSLSAGLFRQLGDLMRKP